MPPKKSVKVCDLCNGPFKATEEVLHCEGNCRKLMHRYCAGMTQYHYLELTNSSTLFVCFVCSQQLHKAEVQNLQKEVAALKAELNELRTVLTAQAAPVSHATSPSAGAAQQALQSDVQKLQASYADVVANGRRRGKLTEPNLNRNQGARAQSTGSEGSATENNKSVRPSNGWQTVQPRASRRRRRNSRESTNSVSTSTPPPTSQEVPQQQLEGPVNHHKQQSLSKRLENMEKVHGVRKVWGTMKTCSSGAMATTIARLCPAVTDKIRLRRKYKSNEAGRVIRWWFVIRGEEEVLVELENMWDPVFNQTSWKLEDCLKLKEDIPTVPDRTEDDKPAHTEDTATISIVEDNEDNEGDTSMVSSSPASSPTPSPFLEQ